MLADKIAMDPSKIDTVSEWPTSQSQWEVQQSLGLANYYRRFVKIFAKQLQQFTENEVYIGLCLIAFYYVAFLPLFSCTQSIARNLFWISMPVMSTRAAELCDTEGVSFHVK